MKKDIELTADVLVIGGGPAGTWAAITAAANGSDVILVDKGYCGTSGATAPSGTGVWYVERNEEARQKAKESRFELGGRLAEDDWMNRVLNQTYENMNKLFNWGYPFPLNDQGNPHFRNLQGPEYMRLMRRLVRKAGVKILDHSPALELLADHEGVGGAAGIRQQTGETWKVKAGAVILASGGCTFLSKALGCNVLTGDGYLLAAEAGADFSGMEFSNAYAISPEFSSVTKTAYYRYASFYYEDGSLIEGAGSTSGRSVIAKNLLQNRKVYAVLDKVPEDLQPLLRVGQTNFFLPFDRLGINPFKDKFSITLRLEGTVRGTGGINLIDQTCATKIPGLYAAGDAATREFICGGFTGGGSHNAAWAMSSGTLAGKGASDFAASLGVFSKKRDVVGLSSSPLTKTGNGQSSFKTNEYIRTVQEEVYPYDRNLFRSEQGLRGSIERLDSVWKDIRNESIELEKQAIKAREASAMAITARLMYQTALARTESRGMHKRNDFQQLDDKQHYRLISSGLDEISIRTQSVKQEAIL
ncbi:FAD-binding protein [Metabacillus fastidiosus]|uniref:FAD-binding protein n=1 Tax=Metabacillus fastidiosus TaxID=1458 RepID=UPI002DBEF13B|nr:FAD-binding protein [Metabacillus fastidiosus]MEC2078175.1 FAD-binding protein [Metabacillus fastidiosus]